MARGFHFGTRTSLNPIRRSAKSLYHEVHLLGFAATPSSADLRQPFLSAGACLMIAYDQPLVPNRSSFQADPASAVADVVRRVVPQFVPANLRLRQGPTNQSIRDAITGLFSRHYLEDSLGREFARARLSSDTLSIVVLHVDNFRRFTHECGRAAGNTLLQVIGTWSNRKSGRQTLPVALEPNSSHSRCWERQPTQRSTAPNS
jgi:GGDEF domain-containing protein